MDPGRRYTRRPEQFIAMLCREMTVKAVMLLRWYRGIISYFHHRFTNSLAEGLNNLIYTVIKKEYGYRDWEYLKLKTMQQQLEY